MDLTNKAIEEISAKLLYWWEAFAQKVPNILMAVLVFAIFYFLSGWAVRFTHKAFKKVKLNQAVESLIESTIGVIVICLGIFFALGVVGLDKTVLSLLAGVGVIGLALGFAFQDIATNLMSGVFIAIQGPFDIGHLIKVGDLMGFVEDIRLRDTVVRNFSGQLVYVPNKSFNGSNLINYSASGERRLEINVGIGYEDDIELAINTVKDAVGKIEGLKKDKSVDVSVSGFGDSSINLTVWFWIVYPGGADFILTNNEATKAIKSAFDEKGINIPFPIRTLDIPQSTIKDLGLKH